MAGRRPPLIRLPEAVPFEACSPASRARLARARGRASDAGRNRSRLLSLEDLNQAVAEGLKAEQYRNLNNGNNQAPGASRMMVRGIDSFDQAVAALAKNYPQAAESAFRRLLDSPYPFAHFLALRELRNEEYSPRLAAQLASRLESFAKTADTVGFSWTCEVLAEQGSDAVIPLSLRYAEMQSPAGLHGPAGMGFGYPAAKAAARLAGRLSDPAVERLLASENVWLRAGAIAGLSEANAPGLADLAAALLREPQPAILRDHAAVASLQLKESEPASRTAERPASDSARRSSPLRNVPV